jgi:hypothetical protein
VSARRKPKPAPSPQRPADEAPTCDGCGARGPVLTREVVEGVMCDRCPDCQRDEVIP